MKFENIIIVIFLSFFSLIFLNFVSRKLLLFDYPSKHKNHKMPTPYTGGIALISLFFFLIKFLNTHELFEIVLTYSILIILIGFFDDFMNLNPGPKLFFLCLPIILLVYGYELIVIDIGEYKYFGNLVFIKFSIIFTILSILLLINAFNYFDGSDGQLSSQAIISLCYLIFLSKNEINNYLFFIIIFLLIFLFFNVSKNKKFKMFLGDCGSLTLGFIIAFTIIIIYKESKIHPAFFMWSVAIFVFDFLHVTLSRFVKKINPFLKTKNHLHDIKILISRDIKSRIAIVTLINLFFITYGYIITNYISVDLSLISFILFFLIYFKIKQINLS